jgi:hypothetical protein
MASLCVAMIAAAIVGVGATSSRTASDGTSPRDPPLTLQIRLTVASDLPPIARESLTREAKAIWRHEGVHINWLSPVAPAPESGLVLRVLVIRLLGAVVEDGSWPVGRLLPDQSGDRLAIVSITAAEQVLASARREAEPPRIGVHRLGLVLGRAVAHEIGHYLLGPRSHTRYGLMRATIDAADFSDLRGGGFFLDNVPGSRIRDAFIHGVTSSNIVARVPR